MEATVDTKSEQIDVESRNERVSDTVVTAVAEAKGVDPLELDPLYDVVDPDALNTIFQPAVGSSPTSVEVRFSMADCLVVISGADDVTVIPQSESDSTATVDLTGA